MNDFFAAFGAELLKARRSRLPWITAGAFTIAAGVGGLFMFILADPDRARSLGLLGDKAQLVGGGADWPGYFALLCQIVAVGGLLVYGVISIWLFGREFTDRTAKDLLALPVSRTAIMLAKFATAALWCLLLAVQVHLLGLLIGAGLGLAGWSPQAVANGSIRLLITAVLTIALTTPFALAASVGRGYLAAVGVMFAALFCAQIIAALGFGQYFPYSVPSLYAGTAGAAQPSPGALGHLLVVSTGLIGVVGTVLWWRHADHHR